MSRILCIDTATDVCTVALVENGNVIANIDSGNERSHAKQLAIFIEQVLKKANWKVSELSAVAVSKGPGSYTGLRIGVSTAKGLCYGANIPLISVSTLHAMCYGVPKESIDKLNSQDYIYGPMLDARRMEVYTALYNSTMTAITDVNAKIIDEDSFCAELKDKKIIFFGTGAEKTETVVSHKNAIFCSEYKYSSVNMAVIASEKYDKKDFEDVAYFEPYYLKDFIATTPKKNLLLQPKQK
jgi:tRNA threonylcarbamoyladenosine biosynthesis protein TsaB